MFVAKPVSQTHSQNSHREEERRLRERGEVEKYTGMRKGEEREREERRKKGNPDKIQM